MDQYPFKMRKDYIIKKMVTVVLLSFVLVSISIPLLYKGTEAAASEIYNPKETNESMQNSTMTMENQTRTDNQTDKTNPGVPEPILEIFIRKYLIAIIPSQLSEFVNFNIPLDTTVNPIVGMGFVKPLLEI